MVEISNNYITTESFQQALNIINQCENILEYAAQCGKVVDRNLIILVFYNKACAYQSQWILDKCCKYLDGVVFNVEKSIKEDLQSSSWKTQDKLSYKIKKQTFLVKCYLQFCAILSQQGHHEEALEIIKKGVYTLMDTLKDSLQLCEQESKAKVLHKKSQNEEINFQSELFSYAKNILKTMLKIEPLSEMCKNKQKNQKMKKHLYFWKNNPENNEKHIRQELVAGGEKQETRSLLGIQDDFEWIENFNIGSIMHMETINYEDISYFGDPLIEVSKKMILKKVIYLSVCYFTIATEVRFLEIETKDKVKEIDDLKNSEVFHLKAVEIVCAYVTSKSPYINHLISSYHKHYNSKMKTIDEESHSNEAITERAKAEKAEKINGQKKVEEIFGMIEKKKKIKKILSSEKVKKKVMNKTVNPFSTSNAKFPKKSPKKKQKAKDELTNIKKQEENFQNSVQNIKHIQNFFNISTNQLTRRKSPVLCQTNRDHKSPSNREISIKTNSESLQNLKLIEAGILRTKKSGNQNLTNFIQNMQINLQQVQQRKINKINTTQKRSQNLRSKSETSKIRKTPIKTEKSLEKAKIK